MIFRATVSKWAAAPPTSNGVIEDCTSFGHPPGFYSTKGFLPWGWPIRRAMKRYTSGSGDHGLSRGKCCTECHMDSVPSRGQPSNVLGPIRDLRLEIKYIVTIPRPWMLAT